MVWPTVPREPSGFTETIDQESMSQGVDMGEVITDKDREYEAAEQAAAPGDDQAMAIA